MKAGREHRVPLSRTAFRVIKHLHGIDDTWVFPSPRYEKHLSTAAMATVLKRMERHDITVHGFRSTFRDWAAEQTAYPLEVCEMALAHTISNATEAAYRRGDLLEKRAKLMESWAKYCSTKPAVGNVTPINAATV